MHWQPVLASSKPPAKVRMARRVRTIFPSFSVPRTRFVARGRFLVSDPRRAGKQARVVPPRVYHAPGARLEQIRPERIARLRRAAVNSAKVVTFLRFARE